MKFGTQMKRGNISKTRNENLEKERGLGHVTPKNFGVHPNVSPKRVEVETSHLVYKCRVAMSQKPAKKNNSEKWRGLGHVTLINFGVPPNICTKRGELETSNLVHRCRVAISQKPQRKIRKKGVA